MLKSLFKMLVAGIVIIALGIVTALFIWGSSTLKPIDVGIANANDENTKMVTQFISSLKSVRSICNFVYMDEFEVRDGVENGQLSAGIILTENFYDDVDKGINTPIEVYLRTSSDNRAIVFKEVLLDGVSVLQTAEAGIYSTYYVVREEHPKRKLSPIGDVLMYKYIEMFFERNKMFKKEVYSALGNLSSNQFDFLAIYIMFILLWGMLLKDYYKKVNRTMRQCLGIYNIKGWIYSIYRVIVIALIIYLLQAIIFMIGYYISEKFQLDILFFESIIFLYMIPISVAISGFFNLIYLLAYDENQGARIIFWSGIFMIIAGGVIVPSAYLPTTLAKIGNVMPITAVSYYYSSIFFELNYEIKSVVLCFIIVIFEIMISEVISCIDI